LGDVYQCDTEGEPVFIEVPAPTDEALKTVLLKIFTACQSGVGLRRAISAALGG